MINTNILLLLFPFIGSEKAEGWFAAEECDATDAAKRSESW